MDFLSTILSSRVRAEIFRLLFGLEERELHLREIVRRSGLTMGTVQGELKKLVKLDLIRARRDGNRLYYSSNKNHPLYGDIRNLVIKTSGLSEVLYQRLKGIGIKIAFVFGSVAEGKETAGSDIDLLIIGTIGLRRLSRKLSGVSEETGREVNPFLLTPNEYKQRYKDKDHFLSRVLEAPKMYIIGGENDLRAMGEK